MDYILLHTTTDSEELADRLTKEAINRRLAACVQVVPVKSTFRWNGGIESAEEYRCEMKTHARHAEALRNMVSEIHTYEVPEIVEIAIQYLSPEYQTWLDDQLESAD